MANLTGTFPFEPGTVVKLAAAVGVYPIGTQVYVCFYENVIDTTGLIAVVRADDEGPFGSFDLRVTAAKLVAL